MATTSDIGRHGQPLAGVSHTDHNRHGQDGKSIVQRWWASVTPTVALVAAVVAVLLVAAAILTGLSNRVTGYQSEAEQYLPATTSSASVSTQAQAPADSTSAGTGGDTGLCREYTKDVTIAGRTETIYGTACRQPDGSWDISG